MNGEEIAFVVGNDHRAGGNCNRGDREIGSRFGLLRTWGRLEQVLQGRVFIHFAKKDCRIGIKRQDLHPPRVQQAVQPFFHRRGDGGTGSANPFDADLDFHQADDGGADFNPADCIDPGGQIWMRLGFAKIAEDVRIQQEHASVFQIGVAWRERRGSLVANRADGIIKGVVLGFGVARGEQVLAQVRFGFFEILARDDDDFAAIAAADELGITLHGGVNHIGEMVACFGGLPVVGPGGFLCWGGG